MLTNSVQDCMINYLFPLVKLLKYEHNLKHETKIVRCLFILVNNTREGLQTALVKTISILHIAYCVQDFRL